MVCALKYCEENNKREDERGQLYCQKLTMFWQTIYLTLNEVILCWQKSAWEMGLSLYENNFFTYSLRFHLWHCVKHMALLQSCIQQSLHQVWWFCKILIKCKEESVLQDYLYNLWGSEVLLYGETCLVLAQSKDIGQCRKNAACVKS